MTVKFIPVLLLAALIVGCGSPKVWYQRGHTAEDAWRDFGDCKMQAAHAPYAASQNMSGLGEFMSASIAQGDYLNACMVGKGYRQVPATSITNGADFPK